MDGFAQFPKNLAYSIKTLDSFSKTTVKLTGDRTSCRNGDSIKVKLPTNTIVDLRTFALFAEGTAQNGTGNKVHFPRLTQSLIKNLSVFINGTLIERISDYNILYNKLFDMDGGGIDQIAKRHLEIADPSIRYSVAGDTIPADIFAGAVDAGGAQTFRAGTPLVCCDGNVSSDTARKLAITNWMGFLSTASCPCIDTNDCGTVEIQLDFDSERILFAGSAASNTAPVLNNPSWELNKVYFTISKIQFNNPLYYNLKASKLLSSGLQIGYQTYIGSKASSVAKDGSVNVSCTVNSTSLDQLVCCFNPEVPSINPLMLYNSNSVEDSLTFQQVLSGYDKQLVAHATAAAYVAQTLNVTKIGEIVRIKGQYNASPEHTSYGDAYNQSYYFKSDAIGLGTSSIEINNTPLHPSPLEDAQIYNESLIALGNLQQDMGSGVYPGLRSLSDYLKYFFVHIVSLENIQSGDFYKSGLDGKSSSLNIVWKLAFSTTDTMRQTPYIFDKCTRIVQINEGNSVIVIV